MKTEPRKKWLRYADLMVRFDISRSTVERWVDDGALPKPERSKGRHPRWWGPMVDEYERRRVEALE